MLLYKHNTKITVNIDRYLDVRITNSFKEFKEYSGKKFFMLSVFDIWSVNSTAIKTDIDWDTVFLGELIQELKTKKYPILFESASEWCIKSNLDTVVDFCNYIGINPNDVYICLANPQSVNLNINSYPELKQYNFLSIDLFAFDAVQFGCSMDSSLPKFKFDTRKRFLFLNRRYSTDRAYMYFQFHKLNLLDKMHSTFELHNVYNENLVTLDTVIKDIEKTHNTASREVIDYINSNNTQIQASLPHKIRNDNPLYNLNHKKSYLYSLWNIAAHNSTDINIISETFKYYKGIKDNDIHYQTLFFITEKTYRTILMKQPFILFSNPYALKYLRDAGYKTFSPFIDESYDIIENLADRQNAIVKEVNRLHNMGEYEFNKLLDNCKIIADHNYNNLMKRKLDKFHNTIWSNDKFKTYLRDIDLTLKSGSLLKRYNKY